MLYFALTYATISFVFAYVFSSRCSSSSLDSTSPYLLSEPPLSIGRLEEHWNGEILNSIYKAVDWAKTMTWKGINPIVHLCEKVYEKGIKLTTEEMKSYENRIIRSVLLPKWDIMIEPLNG